MKGETSGRSSPYAVAMDSYALASPRAEGWRGWRLSPFFAWVCGVLLVTGVILECVLLGFVVRLHDRYSDQLKEMNDNLMAISYRWPRGEGAQLHYECLYPASGGTLGPTGDLPQKRLRAHKCKDVLDWYFENGQGQYWADLNTIANEATVYFTDKDVYPKDGKHMLIFDIDETVLSNLETIRSRAYQPKDAADVSADDSEAVMAPALAAMRDFYQAAYADGYAMAFITGRTEDSREATTQNLKAEGFGEQCPTGDDGSVQRTDEPCYVELHLRSLEDDMDKLASVYKPERRKQLKDKGYTLVGAFGDQFSDLDGLHSATAVWKLPNPMYYIL